MKGQGCEVDLKTIISHKILDAIMAILLAIAIIWCGYAIAEKELKDCEEYYEEHGEPIILLNSMFPLINICPIPCSFAPKGEAFGIII